ncbi:DEAD/DEAH box helicase [Corynebacterium glutamicum]|uniref:DEAD/DEAH box helicase n=1 Tax=Corynebacterium glutamicum TaxID=1718 RepID=UPI001C6EB0D1|nr:DEAD/DEAH box helicase [Corynebacterium glutamicum]QYR18220.1 DEAD/DEAH box helicase [Corynebacterium glutamicum]
MSESGALSSTDSLSPGVTIEVRDEIWLVTHVTRSTDGFRVKARGLSDYVRDHEATFFTALDKDLKVIDPTQVTVSLDDSSNYRRTRLWLEATMRKTPVPLYQESLSVADQMLADPLEYQLAAVRKTLSSANLRPRVLIADAVGLGKTLEMGMILAELIRRGRGERILVVTPRHIMEQFQQEMWTRFAIPLVRLDSVGIQQVRQKLPASRNPFTYFPRVIVSMDTLKSPKYRAQLEKVHWDAVVIDEIHNATNAGTQNNELARTLAPTAEALILASATPHNGDPESFKEILRLLDPTAVMPDGTIDAEAAQRLIIRRHRNSPEVSGFVGEKWAPRNEPQNFLVAASKEENGVAAELNHVWISPGAGNPIKDRLFPWTLVKAFLSSPAALGETVSNRLKKASAPEEKRALETLSRLNSAITPQTSQKYQSLLKYLGDIGVKKNSDTRVVIFSERVATLHWLQENLTRDLKMPANSIAVMHGGLPDQEQMRLVDEFKKTDSPIRIMITGDVASEGVNLHTLCHNLVHYDIPWSLIRIQQRNGRIDRYGQTHNPSIITFLLDPAEDSKVGEVHVLERLMEREHEAHSLLGDAASLMGKHSERLEEETIRDVLRGAQNFNDAVADPAEVLENPAGLDDIDWLLAQIAQADAETEAEAATETENQTAPDAASNSTQHAQRRLYAQESSFLYDCLLEGFNNVPEDSINRGGVGFKKHDNDIVELTPTNDLRRRLDFLPQDYVAARKVKEDLLLASTLMRGQERLNAARTGEDGSTWPSAHYLGPLHPVTSWAADRALATMPRSEIPAATGKVTEPTVLLMSTLSNRRGQIVSRSFVASSGPFDTEVLSDPIQWLHSIGLDETAINPGTAALPDDIEQLISLAVQATRGEIRPLMIAARAQAQTRIEHWAERAEAWNNKRSGAAFTSRTARTAKLIEEQQKLSNALEPDRELIRPLAVILPQPATLNTEV